MTSYTKLCFELLATVSLSYVKLYNAIFRAPPRQVWTVLLNRSEPCIRRLTSRSEPCIRRLTSRSRRLTSRSKPCESRSARRVVQAVASQEPTEHGIPLVSFPHGVQPSASASHASLHPGRRREWLHSYEIRFVLLHHLQVRLGSRPQPPTRASPLVLLEVSEEGFLEKATRARQEEGGAAASPRPAKPTAPANTWRPGKPICPRPAISSSPDRAAAPSARAAMTAAISNLLVAWAVASVGHTRTSTIPHDRLARRIVLSCIS